MGTRSVTPRILLIGAVLIFVNCYWIIQVEGIWHTNHATAMSLFWNTIFSCCCSCSSTSSSSSGTAPRLLAGRA